MSKYLHSIHGVTDKKVKALKNQIIDIQKLCTHDFGREWQEYNIYRKRCLKCGYVHTEEY